MKLGILFSGGKDSCMSAFIAKKAGHELSCLISIDSENKNSFMFHTPSISQVKKQAESMNIPIIIEKTKGIKETELNDLEKAIRKAKLIYGIEGIVTGAIESVYQSSRIQIICDKLELDCFNPLWQSNQIEILENLIKNNFKVMITGVFAFPLDKKWLGKIIDSNLINEIKKINKTISINPAGEGGEYETFVLNCPLFNNELKIIQTEIMGKDNSWKMEIEVK